MSMITLNVNGRSHTLDVDPATPLLYVLSDDLALRGPKFGCGLGQCGCCTVIARGASASGPATAVRSCVTPVQTMNGAEITTLEGLGTIEKPHPLQKAFIDEQAMQCGFCLSGVMLTAKVALGHGLYTSQTQLVAEELSVPLSRVTLVQGDTGIAPDQGTTSGSQSHPVNFNEGALAQACATAREALVQLASQRMGVPATLLRVEDGVISGGGRASLTYAELVGGKKFNLTLNANAKRKP